MDREAAPGRQSNFELLRIVSMLMIILHHYAGHGGGRLVDNPYGGEMSWLIYATTWLQKSQAIFLYQGGQIGVNVFVMISGYFLCKTYFKSSRLFRLLLCVAFYWLAINLTLISLGRLNPGDLTLIQLLFPTLTNRYWFATSYVTLYLISPFLNILIEAMTARQHLSLVCLLGSMTVVIPGLLSTYPYYTWFVFLYFLASYIRLYPAPTPGKAWPALLSYALVYIAHFFYLIYRHKTFSGALETKDVLIDLLCQGHRLPIFICSLLLFIGFRNWKTPDIPVINLVAGGAFGVYLIHDSEFLRGVLWRDVVRTQNLFFHPWYILYAALTALAVYAACLPIDLIRRYLIEKPATKLFERLFGRRLASWEKILEESRPQ